MEYISGNETEEVEPTLTNVELQNHFGQALAKVLGKNQSAREFIKVESLKKINHDNDVLYHLIKNIPLDVEGNTLEGLISDYLTPSILGQLEKTLPTLTIFVPTLPEDSFSPDSWNPEDQIPKVAIRDTESYYTTTFDSEGNEGVIEPLIIPGYPIVVVKENERIVVDDGVTTRGASLHAVATRSGGSINLSFLDNTFNNIDPEVTTRARESNSGGSTSGDRGSGSSFVIPDKVKKIHEAYNIYGLSFDKGWQRDYIYYGITPQQTKGPFNRRMTEHIVAFEMVGDAKKALDKIADQASDPKIKGIKDRGMNSGRYYIDWTDGEFEFKVTVYLGAKSPAGSERITYFRLRPGELFDVYNTPRTPDGSSFQVGDIIHKKAWLEVPLLEWDLENYSPALKISIEEVDPSETTTTSVTNSAEFATNFSYDANFGQKVKHGLKFGTSTKETRTVTHQVVRSWGNDELGDVIINFEDPVVLDDKYSQDRSGEVPGNTIYNYNNKYSTGWYRLYVAPIQMY